MFIFFCRVISHMYIVISLKRLQNAETINNKKNWKSTHRFVNVTEQIANMKKHSVKYRMCSILLTHVPDSCFEKGLFRMKMIRTYHIPIEKG